MSIKKTYAVFGLGRYGLSVAKELEKSGAEVISVDFNEHIVDKVSVNLSFCKCGDTTNIEVLKQLGIANVDTVVVAMAENIEASVMTVMLCKELGVPNVIAKCSSEMHYKILNKVGADKVIFPEKESGIRLAKNLLSSGFIDAIELTEEVSIIELDVKKEWIGKSLLELNLRKKYSLNIIAVKEGNKIETTIDPQLALNENMKLIVVGNTNMFSKFR